MIFLVGTRDFSGWYADCSEKRLPGRMRQVIRPRLSERFGPMATEITLADGKGI